ncbi:MAG: RagB/SusD family nutrient uptake outer membrane protein, partial [Bacteroidota bacterium]
LVLVNQIRKRAGVDAFSSLTLDQIFEERGREMFAEMTRRQDQIRFGKWSGTWWEKPSTAAKTHQVIFPIPKPQLNSNAKLKQNPGYN